MRVLQILPNLRKGGAERLVLDICIALKKINIETVLVTFSDINEYPDLTKQINWKQIKSTFIPSISGKSNANIAELEAFICEFKPTIIHSHLWEAEIVSRQISYPKAKWFSHFHDNMPQLQKGFPFSKKQLTNVYERRLMLRKYKNCKNNFICIGNDTYNYAKYVLPKHSFKKISILNNAIDYSRFVIAKKEISKELNLINVGSLVNKKNQKFLLDVMVHLKKQIGHVHLSVLGSGPNRGFLKNTLETLHLERDVVFHGNVDKVEDYLWKSTIYVHSATYEPFGLVLLEAMAAGLPVVTLDGRGNRDIIEQGKNGYMIFEEDAELFASKILEIWQNKKRYNIMSQYAINYAKQYDIKQYVIKLLSLYRFKL
ncbi:MAG: glycosyltransferase [Salinivirgaceae bacterium]|nr:glycosyltransferase [Salinivirgaceae bacterium]